MCKLLLLQVLNVMSNRVVRTMLYGDQEDNEKLLKEMEAGFPGFINDWVAGREDSEEALYYNSLMTHLRKGLDAPPPKFKGAYGNAYQRLVTLLVKELGTRSVPVNREVFDSFVRWESSLRKNLTEVLWDPHPKELTGMNCHEKGRRLNPCANLDGFRWFFFVGE